MKKEEDTEARKIAEMHLFKDSRNKWEKAKKQKLLQPVTAMSAWGQKVK